MRQKLTLIPENIGPADVAMAEPGGILEEAVRLNFAQPAPAPFHVRLVRPLVVDDRTGMIEVQQTHPAGVGWAILEFPVERLPAGTRIRFEARLMPARPVVLAANAPGVNATVATFEVTHRLAGYEAVVDEALAAQLYGAEWVRLGLTLPRGTWFVFQLSAATVELAVEGVA